MRVLKTVVLALLSNGALAAGESFPSLVQPDPSNPAVAAFISWHTALLKGDFATYRRFTPVIPNMSDGALRQMFDQLRSTAPKSVKVTTPKTNANGSVEFNSVGCMGDRPVVSTVSVGKQGGAWMVGGSGWGPSWNPKISEFVKCP